LDKYTPEMFGFISLDKYTPEMLSPYGPHADLMLSQSEGNEDYKYDGQSGTIM